MSRKGLPAEGNPEKTLVRLLAKDSRWIVSVIREISPRARPHDAPALASVNERVSLRYRFAYSNNTKDVSSDEVRM